MSKQENEKCVLRTQVNGSNGLTFLITQSVLITTRWTSAENNRRCLTTNQKFSAGVPIQGYLQNREKKTGTPREKDGNKERQNGENPERKGREPGEKRTGTRREKGANPERKGREPGEKMAGTRREKGGTRSGKGGNSDWKGREPGEKGF